MQYDAKLLHGIEQDTKNKFEHLMSEFLKRKIDAYHKGLEAVAEQLKELSARLDAMDAVPNPFEGDELFQERTDPRLKGSKSEEGRHRLHESHGC